MEAKYDAVWLKRLSQLAVKRKGKLMLVRNRNTNFKGCQLTYVDCIKQRYFKLSAGLDMVNTIDLEAYIDRPDLDWEYEPFFTVCTNGKKDKCCSKFGFPVFKFFENMPLPFCYNVWESTHVGGDRFAANVVLMPFGIYYGRVVVEDVHEIIKQTASGNIYFSKYRGLSTRSFFLQSVECYLREYLNDYNIQFNMKVIAQNNVDDTIYITIDAPQHGIYDMELIKEIIDYPYKLTCTSAHPETITKYRLVGLKEKG